MDYSNRKIDIFDTTMRDGEQSPGIVFDPAVKIKITEQLVKLGIDVIEAGFPANKEDFKATEAVAKNVGQIAITNQVEVPVICGLARANFNDIDICWRAIKYAKKPRIHTFIATSSTHMVNKLSMNPAEVKQKAAEAVKYAKRYTSDVEFSPEDATRSDKDFLIDIITLAVNAGATTINIPDTTGYATPWEFEQLIKEVVGCVKAVNPDAKVSAHCHDDLGMATVNSMAAIRGGAAQIECTVNGIGERAGNAALEEIVAALVARAETFEAATDIKTKEIQAASQLVIDLSGYDVPYNKAVVGRNAFAHESGIHQSAVIRDRNTYEILNPANFGARSVIVGGKHSGRAGRLMVDVGEQNVDAFENQKAIALTDVKN
jgi:2-isopropylmalate synthase